MSGGETSRFLTLKLHYAIVDLQGTEAVNYGVSKRQASASFYTEKADWFKLVEMASKQTIRHSPFINKHKKMPWISEEATGS